MPEENNEKVLITQRGYKLAKIIDKGTIEILPETYDADGFEKALESQAEGKYVQLTVFTKK